MILYGKMNSMKTKKKSKKILGKSIGEKMQEKISQMSPKALTTKEKQMIDCSLSKFKTLALQNISLKNVKAIVWQKIFTIHKSDFLSRICKEL